MIKRVEGLLFNYLHFYGTYDYVGDSRKWYHKEVRIIRNDKRIQPTAMRRVSEKDAEKIRVKPVDATVYHYGWVKNPQKDERKTERSAGLLLGRFSK